MDKTEAKAAEVLEAVREHVSDQGFSRSDVNYALVAKIAAALHVNPDLGANAWDRSALHDKLGRQVTSALNKLAAGGVLRKSGPKDPGPDGRTSRWVTFWTPAAWDEAAGRAADRDAAEREVEQRWQAVRERIGRLGLAVTSERGYEPRLLVDDWEWLLGYAETGRLRQIGGG